MRFNKLNILFILITPLYSLSTKAQTDFSKQVSTEWTAYGYNSYGGRFSPVKEINVRNVSKLAIAWIYRTGELDFYKGTKVEEKAAFEATPLMIGGVLFFSTPSCRVFALDAGTGKEKWKFDPRVNLKENFSEITSRGVSFWKGITGKNKKIAGRIFIATLDGRLIALNIDSGKPINEFGENGTVNFRKDVGNISITSPPAVVGNVIIVGSSMGDNQKINYERGVVRGYDAISGKLLWSWDPIPRLSTDTAYNEWRGMKAQQSGAANAWAVISADVNRNIVYIPTSSPSPDYYGGERKGRNNYANSVVALEARTGKMKWSFQVVHHDLWDFDIAAQPLLFDYKKNGKSIPAIAIGTKMGHVFILNRVTGKPLLPVEERKVPPSDLPGEEAYPTQLFPLFPPALGLHDVSAGSAWGLTKEDKEKASARIASLHYAGIFTPPGMKGTLVAPSNVGGIHWGGMCFDPIQNLLITNVNRIAAVITLIPREKADSITALRKELVRAETGLQIGTPYILKRDYLFSIDERGLQPQTTPPWGTIAAINISKGTIEWEKPLGYMFDPSLYPESKSWGSLNFGGTIVTGGGLSIVAATFDNHLRAFETKTGKLLWEDALPASGQATPMTYSLQNKQFIVIAAGGHGKLRTKLGDFIVAYSLPAQPLPLK